MKVGALLFAVIAGGYVLFELSMLHKLSYRMEADYILDRMVSAQQAALGCGGVKGEQVVKFARRLDKIKKRAVAEWREENPDQDETAAQQAMAATIQTAADRISEQLALKGCDDDSMRTLQKRFERYASRG